MRRIWPYLFQQHQLPRLGEISSLDAIEIDSTAQPRSIKLDLIASRCFLLVDQHRYFPPQDIVDNQPNVTGRWQLR